MNFFQAILLGIVQGLTEWLPVSSSAQVTLLGSLSEMSSQEAFSFGLFLHLGTVLAVLVKFRDIRLYLNKFIIIATLFTGILGIPLYFFVTRSGTVLIVLIALSLILTGVILFFSHRSFGKKTVEEADMRDGIIVGLFQGCSILPGISRSGVTIASLLLRGFSQREALNLSFLMSVPAVFGGIVLELLTDTDTLVIHAPYILIGVLFAFLTGYAAMDLLLRVARRVRFEFFCIGFGVLTLVMAW
jgi:undecaprenyl-diphosphatase